jgi:tetratricopeptide (TPR) repeat protein
MRTAVCPNRSSASGSTEVVRAVILLVLGAIFPVHLAAQSGPACDVQQMFSQADALLKSRHYAESRALLKQLRSCHQLPPTSTFALGWLYGRSHDFKTALEIFRSLPSSVPDELTHDYAIALTEFELGDYAKSVEALKPLESAGRLDSKCANLLGVSYSKLGLYDYAYNVLTSNLSQNPSDLFSYLNLVTLLADAGHFLDAANIANQAVSVFPQDSGVWVVRGSAYTLMGDLEKARSDFTEAVRLAPRQPGPRFLLALSEYRLGDYVGASAAITASIESGVADSDLHYLQAECLLKIDPTTPSRALAELKVAIELNSRAVAARTLRGKLLLEMGRYKEAIFDLATAHRIDPTSRSAAYNLARADFKSGKTREANALFQKLQARNGDSLAELGDQKLHKALSAESPQ